MPIRLPQTLCFDNPTPFWLLFGKIMPRVRPIPDQNWLARRLLVGSQTRGLRPDALLQSRLFHESGTGSTIPSTATYHQAGSRWA